MERTTILPYEWFNKMVRVSAYSGEERRSEIDSEGISEPQHVMVRDYVGWLVNADETGLLLVLQGGKSLFLSASTVLSVHPTEE
jgi:hypothetical protein